MSKRWSREYDECQKCGTTTVLHQGRGLCRNCYMKERRSGPKREEILKKIREYRQRPEVKEQYRVYTQSPRGRKSARERSKRWRDRNPERAREVLANWRARNPDKIKAYNARPDVKERNRHRILNKKYGENGFLVLERDKYTCQKCGSEKQIQIHHIDWDKKNNEFDNLILLCNSCHQKLHTFVPMEFRRTIFDHWMAI